MAADWTINSASQTRRTSTYSRYALLSSMPSFICLELVADGKCCLTTFHLIQQFIITFGVGKNEDFGNRWTKYCLNKYAPSFGIAPQATAAIIDTQKGLNDGKKGEVYGFDGGKLVKGRKRHIVVDTLGLLMSVVITEANAGGTIRSNSRIARTMLWCQSIGVDLGRQWI